MLMPGITAAGNAEKFRMQTGEGFREVAFDLDLEGWGNFSIGKAR